MGTDTAHAKREENGMKEEKRSSCSVAHTYVITYLYERMSQFDLRSRETDIYKYIWIGDSTENLIITARPAKYPDNIIILNLSA